MTSPRTYQTQAIVIKQTKLGEADKIVTLYTLEFGKLKAVAKGACRPGSKLGGNVEPPNYSLLMLAKGRNLDIITQSQTVDGFSKLRGDLWCISCGFYILELIDVFTTESSPNEPLFDLLLDTLKNLSPSNGDETVLRYFELQLLHHLGYRPQLHKCVVCSSSLKPGLIFFSPGQGGALCPECNHAEFASRAISIDALKVLRLWQDCNYSTASRVKMSSKLSSELRQLMQEYITYLLQREVKSMTWLEQLRKGITVDSDCGVN